MVRAKHRYIVGQIRTNEKPEAEKLKLSCWVLQNLIQNVIRKYYGLYGSACLLKMKVRYFNFKTRLFMIECSLGSHRLISSSLPLITQTEKISVRLRTLYVGASLRNCHKFIINYQQEHINKYIGQYKEVNERKQFVDDVMDTRL